MGGYKKDEESVETKTLRVLQAVRGMRVLLHIPETELPKIGDDDREAFGTLAQALEDIQRELASLVHRYDSAIRLIRVLDPDGAAQADQMAEEIRRLCQNQTDESGQ